jgi:hypothetical protein
MRPEALNQRFANAFNVEYGKFLDLFGFDLVNNLIKFFLILFV